MTLNQLLTTKKPPAKQRNFYVYFDEWTGGITNLTNKQRLNSNDPFLITSDPVAGEIMLGIRNIKKYVVADLVDGYKLVLKDDYLRLKKAEDYLSKVPQVNFSVNRDVNIIMYLNSYKLEVNISHDLMYKLTGKIYAENVNFQKHGETYDKITFYIVEKNNPIHLLETIEIDPVELLEKGYIMFDLSSLQTVIALKNVDILTRRMFKSYGLKIKQTYVALDYGLNRKRNKRTHNKILPETIEEYTAFSITPIDAGWIIKSNFKDPHEHRIYKDVRVYITDENPNVLLDEIVLPYDRIGNEQQFIAYTDVDSKKCKLLIGEEGMNITFKFEEMVNV